MDSNDGRAALQKQLTIYRRNLDTLLNQAASHGGENYAPIYIINQITDTRNNITDLENKLRQFDARSSSNSSSTTGREQSVISFGHGNDQRGANITIGDVAGRDMIKGNTTGGGETSIDLPEMRRLIVNNFNDSELRDLCFDLGIDYDSLSGSGKSDKARELVAYAQRRGLIADLLAACRRQRPNAPWPGSTITGTNSSPTQAPRTSQPQPPDQDAEQQHDVPRSPQNAPNQVTLTFQVQGTDITIAWDAPLFGHKTTVFTPPYDDVTLPLVIKALNAIQYPDHPIGGPTFNADEQAVLHTVKLWNKDRVAVNAQRIVGQALYKALGADGKHMLNQARDFGIAQGQTVNYALRFPRDGVQLAMLPWELIADQDQAVLLAHGSTVDSCERYMNIDRAIPQQSISGKQLHLLALSPDYNVPEADRNNEREARLKTWNALRDAGHITYDEIGPPLTPLALNNYIRKTSRRPDIIHYFGHGTYKDGKGWLKFDNGAGDTTLVSATQLAAILGSVRLAVILACQSARIKDDDSSLTSSIAPALSLVTGGVVAMQLAVGIDAATLFADVFYDELLAKRNSLQDAVGAGRQTLLFVQGEDANWYVPTLYIRSREQKPVYMWRAS